LKRSEQKRIKFCEKVNEAEVEMDILVYGFRSAVWTSKLFYHDLLSWAMLIEPLKPTTPGG